MVGIAFGARDDLFPTDVQSQKCLWTEWFDHDTPCNRLLQMIHIIVTGNIMLHMMFSAKGWIGRHHHHHLPNHDYSDGDHEKHTEHFERLYETITGPLRYNADADAADADADADADNADADADADDADDDANDQDMWPGEHGRHNPTRGWF